MLRRLLMSEVSGVERDLRVLKCCVALTTIAIDCSANSVLDAKVPLGRRMLFHPEDRCGKSLLEETKYRGTLTSANQRVERLTEVLVLRKWQPPASVRGHVNVRYYREWAHE